MAMTNNFICHARELLAEFTHEMGNLILRYAKGS